jgi:hypothetical protein
MVGAPTAPLGWHGQDFMFGFWIVLSKMARNSVREAEIKAVMANHKAQEKVIREHVLKVGKFAGPHVLISNSTTEEDARGPALDGRGNQVVVGHGGGPRGPGRRQPASRFRPIAAAQRVRPRATVPPTPPSMWSSFSLTVLIS